MASLSERLKALIPQDYATASNIVARNNYALLDRAASVCALVEAFQAAEQEVDDATVEFDNGGVELRRLQDAHLEWQAAKARLLEVNLG